MSARDGKAEARSAFVLVAGLVEPHEGLEHLLALLGRDAGAVVVDMDHEPARLVVGQDGDAVAVPSGVRYKVEQGPPERVDPHRDQRVADDVERGLVPRPVGVGFQLLKERPQVGRDRHLAEVAAGEGQVAFQHAAHLVDVALQVLQLRRFLEERERQPEPRQDGAKVVADAVQHGGAALDRALDAALHVDEGEPGLAHLARAPWPELHLPPAAEILCRGGELQDRPGSGCAGAGSRRTAESATCRPSRPGRCASSTRRRGCGAP